MKKYRIRYSKCKIGFLSNPYHEKKERRFSTDKKAKEYYKKVKEKAKKGFKPFVAQDVKDMDYYYECFSLVRIDQEEQTTKIA